MRGLQACANPCNALWRTRNEPLGQRFLSPLIGSFRPDLFRPTAHTPTKSGPHVEPSGGRSTRCMPMAKASVNRPAMMNHELRYLSAI
jgi:hypothetical protein